MKKLRPIDFFFLGLTVSVAVLAVTCAVLIQFS
jgi:hypothetical protein